MQSRYKVCTEHLKSSGHCLPECRLWCGFSRGTKLAHKTQLCVVIHHTWSSRTLCISTTPRAVCLSLAMCTMAVGGYFQVLPASSSGLLVSTSGDTAMIWQHTPCTHITARGTANIAEPTHSSQLLYRYPPETQGSCMMAPSTRFYIALLLICHFFLLGTDYHCDQNHGRNELFQEWSVDWDYM